MACSSNTPRTAVGAFELTEQLLVKAHADYDVNYRGYLANHLPHALYTLCVLGASTSRLQQYFDMYVKRLEPISESRTVIDSLNWSTNIGEKKYTKYLKFMGHWRQKLELKSRNVKLLFSLSIPYQPLYSDYLRYFDNEVQSKGLKNTLDLYFSQLMGESLGAALHPLINIGYAMEFNNPILLSEGLAYICIYPLKGTKNALNCDGTVSGNADTTVLHLIKELQGITFPDLNKDGWNFNNKTNFLVENCWTIFRDLIARWNLTRADQFPAKLNELTEASILGVFGTYAKQIDFFLVHGLTANHAVRTIFPNLSETMQRKILKVNLLGLLTDYVVQRHPNIDVDFITGYKDTNLGENPSWDVILKKTISIDEEHVLKVVRCLVHYMETVPVLQRSSLFTDTFLKQCAVKMVNIVQEADDYLF